MGNKRVPLGAEVRAITAGLLQDWARHARCGDRPEVMYPPPKNRRATWAAQDVCTDCPVLSQCREWVLGLEEYADPGGVCGGLTEADRTRARRLKVVAS